MQITTMPTTSLFKTKWNTFITKLSPSHIYQHHQNNTPQQQRRRRSSLEDIYAAINNNTINSNISQQKRRKHSDAMSIGTCGSSVSMADKFRQAIPFFHRRSSSNISSGDDNISTTAASSAAHISNINIASNDFCKELEKLHSLYNLAVDELNYAEDSQGSSYYSGDLITAREALDDCANAFMLLLEHTTDTLTREGLQSSMAPRLLELQKRIDALPEVDEDSDLY